MKYKSFIHHFTFLATQWQENIEIIRFWLLILNFGDLRISKNQVFSNFSFFISPIRKIGTWQPMQIAKRASHRSDKTVWPQKNDTWKLRAWNRSGPGFGWWEIGNSACDWTIGYPRTLSSIPARRKRFHECPVGMSSAMPQQCNAVRITYHWNPMKRICFVVCPWNALSSPPRPSPSSCRNSHFLQAIFAFVCCVRSNFGSSAFRCVSTRLQRGSLLFLEKNCLDLTN